MGIDQNCNDEIDEDEGDDGKFEYWESLLRKMRGKLCNKGL